MKGSSSHLRGGRPRLFEALAHAREQVELRSVLHCTIYDHEASSERRGVTFAERS